MQIGGEGLFAAAVEAIYDAAPEPQRWPQALARIAACFNDVGAILIWRRDDGAFGTIVSERLLAAQRAYEEEGWARRDILALRATERGYFVSGEPFTDHHLCTDREMLSEPTYTDFRVVHELGQAAAIAVSPDPNLGVVLSVHRHLDRKERFGEDELGLLRRLGRHVEKSLRLSLRLLDSELSKLGLSDALARLGIGVFTLDMLTRVTFANQVARQALGEGLAIVDGRLQIGSGDERRAARSVVEAALQGGARTMDRPILVQRANGSALVIYLLPVNRPLSISEQFLTNTRIIVLVLEPKRGVPADPALVRDIFGLTLGEARVAALVGSGQTPREAAKQLGIAEETARSFLKRTFSKTGISRQSELAALLSQLTLR